MMLQTEAAPAESTPIVEPQRGKPSAWQGFIQRRRFVVHPRFQGGLLLSFVMQLTLFASILTVAFLLPPLLVLSNPADHAPHEVEGALMTISPDVLFWPSLATGILLTLLLALRTTHRIAGPLYQFRRVYDALRESEDPGPVRLRKGDFLVSEATSLDGAVRAVVRDRERLAGLEESVRLCLEEIEAEDGADAGRLRDLVRARLAVSPTRS